MRNKIVFGILILIVIIVVLVMVFNNSKDVLRDTTWSRTTDVDTETISFHEDGTFVYYYGVGSPVGDTDLCNAYTYNEKTKVIKLDCGKYKVTDEITVKSITDTTLTIIFENEERTFEKEK